MSNDLRVSVVIASRVNSLAELTDRIGIAPTRGHDIGQPISSRNPAGGLRDYAQWDLVFADDDDSWDFDTVKEVLATVARSRQPDWDVALTLLIHAPLDSSRWVNIHADLIAVLSEAGGMMSIDTSAAVAWHSETRPEG